MKHELIADYLTDLHLSREVKTFLKALNSGGGAPIESLSKEDARKVLVDAQASVEVDLSGIEISEKTISSDGYNVKINIVRPEGVKENSRYLYSSTAEDGYWGISQPIREWSGTWLFIQDLLPYS